MSDIFISYKREEREKARAIAEMLVTHGYDVWWDIELLPGDKFSREIDEVINKASAAIVLWSQKAVDSNFIRAEAHKANNRDILLTVRLDDCELPIPFNISHTTDLSAWDGSPDSHLLDPLVKAVEKKIGTRSKTTQSKSEIKKKIENPQALGEVEYWKSVSDGKAPKIKEYEAYINKYGANGIFHDLAKLKIEELEQEGQGKSNQKKNIQAILIVVLFVLIPISWIIYNKFKTESSRCEGITSRNELRINLFEAIKKHDSYSANDCMNKLDTVNFRNEYGHTPLTSASFHGNLELVKLLINKGAKVNLADNEKGQHRTPLHYAIENDHKKVAKFLICKNAAKNARDSLGKTPLDYDASSFYKNIRCE